MEMADESKKPEPETPEEDVEAHGIEEEEDAAGMILDVNCGCA